ncbi:formate/nitrite transporter family protein [Roseibium sp.]|uniref:formate/nitrite transporter family protein n=1 Tax=Roseibium sp. TaxID=1936156 RepID=UPI003A9797F3
MPTSQKPTSPETTGNPDDPDPRNLSEITEERLAEKGTRLTREDLAEVENRLRLRAAVVYEIIRQEGEEELARDGISLWWSGLAAGLSIGFSIVAEGLLHAYLPDAPWRPLFENLGYSVGFMIVILARQQLFTENTLTAVLPVISSRKPQNLKRTLRLWGIVFLANMAGTLIFAYGLSTGLFFSGETLSAFRDIAHHMMALPASDMFWRGIIAGWIIATLVWLLPSAEASSVFVIIALTYLIALADLTHVIAGSVEAFLLAFDGDVTWENAVFGFLLPTLSGNIIGGSALFAILAHAQVREEI